MLPASTAALMGSSILLYALLHGVGIILYGLNLAFRLGKLYSKSFVYGYIFL